MEDSVITEFSRSMGRLEESVTGLRRDFQEADRRQTENMRRADEQRATVHNRMDALVADVGGIRTELVTIKSDIESTKVDVADAKSVTDQVRQWKLMGMGALGVTGIASSAVTALLATYWQDISRIFRGS